MVLPASAEWPCNIYKQGEGVKQSRMCVANRTHLTRTQARTLVLGGKVNITAIQFKPSELVLHVQTEDGVHKGAVSFQFPKEYLDTMNVKQIQDTISEVFVSAPKNPVKGPTDQAVLAKIVGQYGKSQAPDDRLQLNTDGTFSLSLRGRNFSGPFTIDGDNLMMQMENGAAKGVLQSDSIIDPDGSTWIKKSRVYQMQDSGFIINHQNSWCWHSNLSHAQDFRRYSDYKRLRYVQLAKRERQRQSLNEKGR